MINFIFRQRRRAGGNLGYLADKADNQIATCGGVSNGIAAGYLNGGGKRLNHYSNNLVVEHPPGAKLPTLIIGGVPFQVVRRESAYAACGAASQSQPSPESQQPPVAAAAPVYETIDDAALAAATVADERIYAQLENICDNCECETSSSSSPSITPDELVIVAPPQAAASVSSSRSSARPQSTLSTCSSPRRLIHQESRQGDEGGSSVSATSTFSSPPPPPHSLARSLAFPQRSSTTPRGPASSPRRPSPETTTITPSIVLTSAACSSDGGSEDIYSSQYSEPVNVLQQRPSSRLILLPPAPANPTATGGSRMLTHQQQLQQLQSQQLNHNHTNYIRPQQLQAVRTLHSDPQRHKASVAAAAMAAHLPQRIIQVVATAADPAAAQFQPRKEELQTKVLAHSLQRRSKQIS